EWEKEIGDIFTRNGEYEEAESHYTVALEQIKQLGEEKLEQDILSSFGDLYSKKNEAQKAIKLFKQALSISKSKEESKILKEKIKVLEMNIES
ncbi:MAG: tetratricopeptide repeat protein, partial [Candidatus Hodarchaeota archaeon]